MQLDVSRALKNAGQSYPFEGELTLPEMEVLDDPVRFEGARVSGTFTGAIESVSVVGTVWATLCTRCAKCLDKVELPVSAALDEVYARTVNPEDPDQRSLDGYTVDLTESTKDALLLELPMRFLCREDCKGLCPVCGVNLNTQRCTCQEGGKRQNPFSALGELLTEDEEV